jgi:hypothetical protein
MFQLLDCGVYQLVSVGDVLEEFAEDIAGSYQSHVLVVYGSRYVETPGVQPLDIYLESLSFEGWKLDDTKFRFNPVMTECRLKEWRLPKQVLMDCEVGMIWFWANSHGDDFGAHPAIVRSEMPIGK